MTNSLNGPKNTTSNMDSNSDLRLEIIQGHLKVVMESVERKAGNLEMKFADGKRPLHVAAKHGQTEIAKFLIRMEANTDAIDNDGMKPIHWAASSGSKDIIELLLNKGAYVDDLDSKYRWSPLHYAASRGHLDVVKLLVLRGANILQTDNENKEPVDLAGKNKEVKEYLQSSAINLNDRRLQSQERVSSDKDEQSSSAHSAVQKNSLDLVKFLVEKGANFNVENSNGEKPVHIAVASGRENILRYLLSKGVSVNEISSKYMMTPLHFAAMAGQVDMCKTLVDLGANVNAIDRGMQKPIHTAARAGKEKVVKYLIDRIGSNMIGATGNNGWTPLHYAAASGNLEVCKVLIDKGANMNELDKDETKAINLAMGKNHIEIVKYFLSKGADINDIDAKKNWSLLHYAISEKQTDLVKYLIEKGADPNVYDRSDVSPFLLSVEKGQNEIVDYLLKSDKVDIDSVSKKRKLSAIHKAISENNLETLRLLIERGANTNAEDYDGKKAIHVAASTGNIGALDILLNSKSNSNIDEQANNQKRWTALDYACSNGKLEVVDFLVKKGANINAIDGEGKKAIHVAAESGQTKIIDYLARAGMNINEPEKENNWTPLHIAAYNGRLETMKFLVERGANPTYLDLAGRSVLQVAKLRGQNYDVIEYLQSIIQAKTTTTTAPKQPNNIEPKSSGSQLETNKNGWTQIHHAVWEGKLKLVESLVEKGADLNSRDSLGRKPIHLAASNPLTTFNKELIELLLKGGSNIDDLDTDNKWTPLHYAVQTGRLDLVDFLVYKGASLKSIDAEGRKMMHLASEKGNNNVIDYLLNKGADVNERDQQLDWTPLYSAANNGRLDTMKFLIYKGATLNVESSPGESLIFIAARGGHNNVIEYLLGKSKDDINRVSKKNDWSPLHVAAWENRLETVKFLVDNGANIKAIDIETDKPIHLAAQNGNTEIVKYFLSKGLEVDEPSERYEMTPLHYASKNSLDTVVFLMEQGANITMKNIFGEKPIHLAAKTGQKHTVDYLLGRSDDVDIDQVSFGYNWTPLHLAAGNGHLDTMRFLIERGANISAVDADGAQPLHMSASRGRLNALEFLLDQGANVEAKDLNNSTALQLAIANGHQEVVKKLLEKDSPVESRDMSALESMNITLPIRSDKNKNSHDYRELFEAVKQNDIARLRRRLFDDPVAVEARNKQDWTLLHEAAGNGFLNIVEYLVRVKGAQVESKDKLHNWTPMHRAARAGHQSVVELLSAFGGAKMDVQAKNGARPIHLAAHRGHKKLVKFLLEKGANIEDADKNGWNLLFYAIDGGNLDMIKFLVDSRNAKLDVVSKLGQSALHLTTENERCDIAKFLINHGLSTAIRDKYGLLALHYAVKYGDIDLVKQLTTSSPYGSHISDKTNDGRNVLHIAAQFGKNDILQYLQREHRLKVNDSDKNGYTPLHYSAENGHLDAVKLLQEAKANIEAENNAGETAIHLAAKNGRVEMVNFFFDLPHNNGSSLISKAASKTNWMPLHYASKYNHLDLVKYLVSKGSRLDALDSSGKTAQDLSNDKAIIEYLQNQAIGTPKMRLRRHILDKQQSKWHPIDHNSLHRYRGLDSRGLIGLLESRSQEDTPACDYESSKGIDVQGNFSAGFFLMGALLAKRNKSRIPFTQETVNIEPQEARACALNILNKFEKFFRKQTGEELDVNPLELLSQLVRITQTGSLSEMEDLLREMAKKASPLTVDAEAINFATGISGIIQSALKLKCNKFNNTSSVPLLMNSSPNLRSNPLGLQWMSNKD